MLRIRDRKAIVRIVLIYAAAATGWILLSDYLLSRSLARPFLDQFAHSAKGMFFVGFTALVLYALIRRFMNDRRTQDIEFAAITEQAREAILICDAQLRIIYANQALSEITGYPLKETLGQPVSYFFPSGLVHELSAHVEKLQELPYLRQDWCIQHRDGHLVDLELLTQRLPDGRYLAIGTDVSEIRAAQRAAELERQRLTTLLQAIPDPVWLKNPEGQYIACNPAVERSLNIPLEQIIGHDDSAIHQAAASEDFRNTDQEVIQSGVQTTFEQRFPLLDGSLAFFETTKSPVFSADGELCGVVGIARNVTRERQAVAELMASERRFRTLFENAYDMLFVSDVSGRFISVNRLACTTYGYSRDELLGLSVFDINPELTPEQFAHSWSRLEQEGSIVFRRRDRHRDGHLFPVELRVSKLNMDGQHFALAQIRDISEQENVEAQIRETEALKAAIIDAMPYQMAVIDNQGKIIQVNLAWRQFAYDNCENCDESFCIINPCIGRNFFEACETGEGPDRQQAQAAKAGLQAVLDKATPGFSMESACRTENEERWFILNISPLHRGRAGALLSYIEITQIKQAQLLQEKFRHQLQALARRHLEIQESERHLLSMELHDQVSQALAALKISLFTAQSSSGSPPAVANSIAAASKAVDDIADTIRGIARRLRPPLLDQLGLGSAIRWHIENLPALSDTRIVIENKIANRRYSPEAELAAFRFIQEAVTNALRHARAKQVAVHIAQKDAQLCLEVKDDGIGFDLQEYERTNEQTTLGLLGIRERISQQNGSFIIRSQARAGTTLNAQIPIHPPPHDSN